MFKLFNKNNNFCDASIKPWIFLLAACCVIVLVWGFYRYDNDPERFMENFNNNTSGSAQVLTNFPANPNVYQPGIQQQNRQPVFQNRFQSPQNNNSGSINGGSLHNLENAIKHSISSVRSSVVNVKSTRINGAPNSDGSYESVGSGLIVSRNGLVLTNYHVIANAQNIFVSVFGMGRKTYPARVVDHHIETDLTLLKLETSDIFIPAELGNSDYVETGDMVIAIGSPFGMDQTVTSGIISGVRKTLEIGGIRYDNMLQTDAPINRGSSGGPLVNIDGKVIGINTAIYAPTGVFSGTAFSMPINRIQRFLIAHNIAPATGFQQASYSESFSNINGWLGVDIQSIDRTFALHLGLPYIGGVLVNRVLPDSPASKNGIKRGDVILEINGSEVVDIEHFGNLFGNMKPDEAVEILVYSGKELRKMFIRLSQVAGNNR
jgi:S1-C subfamily serine protease